MRRTWASTILALAVLATTAAQAQPRHDGRGGGRGPAPYAAPRAYGGPGYGGPGYGGGRAYGGRGYGGPGYGGQGYGPPPPPPAYEPPPAPYARSNSLGAQWGEQQDQARMGVRQGRIVPLARVVQNLQRLRPGRVLDAGIETGPDGRATYRVRWAAAGGRRIDFMVDAVTGAVLGRGEQ